MCPCRLLVHLKQLVERHFQSDNQSNGGIVIPLSTGDYVELWVYVNWATSGSVTGSSRCKMTGFLIG